jgi:hypothetical protein
MSMSVRVASAAALVVLGGLATWFLAPQVTRTIPQPST